MQEDALRSKPDPRVEAVLIPALRRGIVLWQEVTEAIERQLLFGAVPLPERVLLEHTTRSFFAKRVEFISDKVVQQLNCYPVKTHLLSMIRSTKVGTNPKFYTLYMTRALIRGMEFDPRLLPYVRSKDVFWNSNEPRRHSLLLGILSLDQNTQLQVGQWFGDQDLVGRNVAFQFLHWMLTQKDQANTILKSINDHWYQTRQCQYPNQDLQFIYDLMIQAPTTADTLFGIFAEISMKMAPFPSNWLQARAEFIQPLQLVI